ncbi:hypothetical protein HU200_005499 [Digitaria exilis]|uniref:Uncharacterized protein n=1 Tax=Digitaria exilis TaxID=1010633 RepID=A0A835FRM4_9POAL|nr:hypothetical protein HU200_005499 [Digitaria exilis]
MIVNNKPASDQQQLVPNDYFECVRKLPRSTWNCWMRIDGYVDLSRLEEEVRETVRRVLLVAAMQKRCSAS